MTYPNKYNAILYRINIMLIAESREQFWRKETGAHLLIDRYKDQGLAQGYKPGEHQLTNYCNYSCQFIDMNFRYE
jgi:hypothetical protein